MAAFMRLYHSGGGTVVSSIISFVQSSESLRINRIFLPVKMAYLFFNAGMSSLMPYMAVYMTYLGLTPFQTGIARGAEPLLHILVGPIWGSISDRYSRHKTIIIMAIILPATFYFSTQFIPPVKVTPVNNNSVTMVTWLPRKHSRDISQRTNNISSHDNPFHTLKSNVWNKSIQNKWDDSVSTSKPTASPKTKTDSTMTFILMILLISCGRLFVSPFNPILDSTIVRMTKEHGGDYGRQRMFASFGFSFAIVSGVAIDAFGDKFPHMNKYTPAFYLYIGLIGLVLLPISALKFPHHTRRQAIYRNVGALFLRLDFIAFLLAAFSSGFSLGAINTFLFIFVVELNGPHVLMGLNLTVCALSSAIVMFFSERLIKKMGHKNIFNLVIFCHALRHFLYSVIYNPWLVVPVALLHGICFGAFWPTCTSYVNIIAPVGMEASVQSIAHATYFGLGRGLGMIIGGIIYNKYGSRNMFRSIAVYCGVILIILWLVQLCSRIRRTTRSHSLSVQYDEI